MSDTQELPDTVSISDAKKRARESVDRATLPKMRVGKEIVKAAFGREIPDRSAAGKLRYDVYDNFDSYKSTGIVGVQIKTRRAPQDFNDFYRGTRNPDGDDRLDAEKVRNKWEEVRQKAEEVQEEKEKKKKRKKKKRKRRKELLDQLSELREELGMEYEHSKYFKENDVRGTMDIDGKGVNLTLKNLDEDQTRQVIELLRSFE